MKAGIVEPEVTPIARRQLVKHFPAATNMQAIIEELLCFLLGPPRSYITRNLGQLRE
jgi:hypothetical protein